MTIDLECPLDVVSSVFDSSTIAVGMRREAPGGVAIELRQFPMERRGGLTQDAAPLVHLALTTGKDVAVGVFASWLFSKISKSRIRCVRINRKTVEFAEGEILRAIEQSIEIEQEQ